MNNSRVSVEAGSPPTRRSVLEESRVCLEAAGIDDARRNAEWLLCEVLGCSRAMLYAYPDEPVPVGAVRALEGMMTRRLRREPLQYILGHTEFYGLRLAVAPGVLIPRPETEQVVEEALRRLQVVARPRVLDVGTGSGCIALAVAAQRPGAEVYALDVSPEALVVAQANARALHLPVHFIEGDMGAAETLDRIPNGLDLVVSNPPYIPPDELPELAPEVARYEPHRALFTGDDPLGYYRALAGLAAARLAPGGHLVVETHADFGEAVRALFDAAGFGQAELRHDLAGLPRIVAAVAPGDQGRPSSRS